MPFFERGKFRMHYEVHEGLVDRDTLAIHGNLASNHWWKPLVAELRAQGGAKKGRFIAAEWRGCGKSMGLSEESEINLAEMAADYNGLLRSLGVTSAAVLGHSTGGPIALHAMLAAPELYSRAILLDPVGATGVQFGPEMYEAFTAMSQDRAMCEAVMTGTISKHVDDQAFLQQLVDDAFGVHPLIWHGVARMLHDTDLRSELPRIKQPVLVLHGEVDQIISRETSEALAKGLPQGRFELLPGRGHSTNVEEPPLLAQRMKQFLYG
ncbi:MAG: alpha/beta fold hydrolase [Bdellovibrionota bacterium]